MSSRWRLLDTGPQNAPYNMALEKVLLSSSALGHAVNTLHFLEFFPCVLLGYSQSVAEEVNEEYCKQNGIEINRRISGGGCIYMDGGTLGWEIIAKKEAVGLPGTSGIPGSLNDMYRKLCGALVAALKKLGINAAYRPLNDVEINGRKICGTGGTELDDSFIFHGSILVDCNSQRMVKALKLPSGKNKYKHISDFEHRTVCMREMLGYLPSMDEVKKLIAEAFAETMGIDFEKGELTAEEIQILNKELPVFGSYEWIYEKMSNEELGIRNLKTIPHSSFLIPHSPNPQYVKTSLAAAISLGMERGRFARGCGCTCLNILLNYKEGCSAKCGYCGLSAAREKQDSFIRVRWPVYSLESILSRINEGQHPFKRVCVSMVTHQRAMEDTCSIINSFSSKSNLPVSALVTPTIMRGKDDMLRIKDAGADRVGIAIDAATPALFDSLRGKGVGGPHKWERYLLALNEAVSVFGQYKAGVHLIVGLGETEKEMIALIDDCYKMGVLTHLFSFYPEPGSFLEKLERPSIGKYRRIQLAVYLINESVCKFSDFRFSDTGEIIDFGVDVKPFIEKGLPFMTSGCPGKDGLVACNRPYSNERPSEKIRNFHFMPNEDDKKDIAVQIF